MLYSYFEHLEKIEQIQDEFEQPLINNIIYHIEGLKEYTFLGLPVIFILDYRSRSYIFFSHSVKSAFGYDYREFIEGGLPFSLYIQNPKDLEVFSQQIFSVNANFLKSIPYSDHNKYSFSHNYRVKSKAKGFIHLKQKSIFLKSTPGGLPMFNLGLLFNVTEAKQDGLITHEVFKNNSSNSYSYDEPLITNYFYPEDGQPVLSKREIEVVKMAASGYSSKQIADKMNISIHTVKRHRSNILIKTNCKNVAELINYTLKEKLL